MVCFFFQFLSPARPSYVEFVKDSSGKVQEAFAEFMSLQDLEVALSKHRKVIRKKIFNLKKNSIKEPRYLLIIY